MENKARYTKKIALFRNKLEQIGESRFCDKFGNSTLSSLVCAEDALKRNQSDCIISDFLYQAMMRFSSFSGEDDLFYCLA